MERQGGGDAKMIAEARKLYEAALVLKPDDAVVRTSLGLTHFYNKPSDPQRAIREYRRALEIEPRHEGALENLALAQVAEGDLSGAEKTAAELEKVDPSSAKLADIRAQLAQKRNAAGGQ
jgi:Flp pilus assembly protein TadD